MTGNIKPTHPAVAGGTNPAVSTTTACTVTHGIFHMHMDADRDGNVDDDCTGLNNWVWGKNKKGAIILCNNDDDDSTGTLDNEDDGINGGNDRDEIAPLEFRKVAGTTPPATMEGYIEVSTEDAQRIRIFDGRAAGAKEIIGPTAGKSYKFPSMSFDVEKYGMEAVIYAGLNFDGLITITFIVKDSGVEKYRENGVVRVAPWIMPNHNDSALKAFVVMDTWNSNSRFRRELNTMVVAAGCTLDQSHASDDIWMQDCMEIGYSNLPNVGLHVVTRAPRDRPLNVFPKTLLEPDFGYNEAGTLSGATTFDSTGNLEATPPCTSQAGKKYPLGRIYYGPGRPGELMDARLREFLHKQVVQKPIEIDTSWLAVGHVDEIISFVPVSGGKGFKLLIASPKLAFEILRDNSVAHGSAKLLTGRTFPPHSVEVSISGFLNTGIPSLGPGYSATDFDSFNTDKQAKLDVLKQLFKTEIGIDLVADIIDVPIIFMPNEYSPIYADALTAGMVNMLVLNKNCIVPKPFGPVVGGKDLFEEDIKHKLTPLGLTVKFLDDWYEYHVNLGEVHCGTNTLRAPKIAKWWEFEP